LSEEAFSLVVAVKLMALVFAFMFVVIALVVLLI